MLGAGARGRPRGSGWRGRWEGGSGWGIQVNPWLIHVNVWQKPLQYCKVISLQLIKINGKKKKNLPANSGDIRDPGSILGWGRFPGGEHGNPLQYSCLENPVKRGAWWATVHRTTNSQTKWNVLGHTPILKAVSNLNIVGIYFKSLKHCLIIHLLSQ